MINIIRQLNVPNVIIRHILMNYLCYKDIKNVILSIKLNVLDEFSKQILCKAGEGFIECCMKGEYDTVLWLYKNETIDEITQQKGFILACANGHLNIVKLVYNHGIIKINPDKDPFGLDNNVLKKNVLELCCSYGRLEVAQWLYSIENYKKNILTSIFIISSCIGGKLSIAQWLYSIIREEPFFTLEFIFVQSCIYGNFELVQWIFSLENNDISLWSYNRAFQTSCKHGHLNIAQWLYNTIDIDIHRNNDYALRKSIKYGHYEISQWILSLN